MASPRILTRELHPTKDVEVQVRPSMAGALERFRTLVDEDVCRYGQFVWSVLYRNHLQTDLNEAIQSADIGLDDRRSGVTDRCNRLATWGAQRDEKDDPGKFERLIKEALAEIDAAAPRSAAGAARLKRIVAGPACGVDVDENLWRHFVLGARPNGPGGFRAMLKKVGYGAENLTARTGHDIENVAMIRCAYTATQVSQYLIQRHDGLWGVSPRRPLGQINAPSICDTIHPMETLEDGRRLGDLLHFTSALDECIRKLKERLDENYLAEAFVFSGYRWTATSLKNFDLQVAIDKSDHYLLLLGYHRNRFLYWDPDAVVSNTVRPAFGLLHHVDASRARRGATILKNGAPLLDHGWFGTAPTEAHLRVFDEYGGHWKPSPNWQPLEKRYQILNVAIVP